MNSFFFLYSPVECRLLGGRMQHVYFEIFRARPFILSNPVGPDLNKQGARLRAIFS